MSNIQVIDRKESEGVTIEILQYNKLSGVVDLDIAERMYFAQKSGIKLKQVKVTLHNAEIITEAGALQYLKGRITQENKIGGMKGLAKRFLNSKLNSESMFLPSYVGIGDVYLEPSFKHFTIIELKNDEIILDDGMFYCCEPSLSIDIQMIKSFSGAVLGSDGLFQTKISGTGMLVVEIPVPVEELVVMELNNEVLQVDGTFAIMRSGGVDFKVQKSNKSMFKSMASGEGFLETFSGTGTVWLAPTIDVYEREFWD